MFTCDHCGFIGLQKYCFGIHVETHCKFKDNVKCEKCGKYFKGILTRNNHISKNHKQFSAEIPITRTKSKRKYSCETCYKVFALLKNLKSHEETHDEKNLQCSKCDQTFNTKGCLRNHSKKYNHPLDFGCFCGSSFMTEKGLLLHQKVAHLEGAKIANNEEEIMEKKRNLNCDKCDRKFTASRYLSRHKYSIHGENRKFPCTICDFSMTTSYSLKYHIEKHFKVSIPCNLCELKFMSETTFKLHLTKIHNLK